jgi:uncharacterized protein
MNTLTIYVDADACPVKEEIYKVAQRTGLKVILVANQYMNIPMNSLFELKTVSGNFDAADDWIVDQADDKSIVITADILLADRCIKKNARVLGHNGVEFSEDNIGSAIAQRELMENLRHMGENRGGPKPMEKKDRSSFLAKLDQIIQDLKRKHKIAN